MGCLYSQSRLSVIAILVSQSILSTTSFAAGFQINEISPSLQGDATAGAAAANNDVSAMFINPATLSTLTGTQGYLGASELFPHAKMTDAHARHTVNIPGIPPSSITATVKGNHRQGSVSPSAFVPDGYFGWRINNKFVAGLALIAPYGLKTAYDYDSVVRFAAVYSSVKTIDINPALSYAINDKLAIGGGFQAQWMQATFSNFNGAYTGVAPIDALIAANFPTHLRGEGWGYGYNLGILYKPFVNTRLGIGYRSQIAETLKGHGQQYVLPGETVPAPSPNFLFNAQTRVNTAVKTPQILTLSAAHDIANWTLKASAQINFWDAFNQISINMPDAFATNSTIQTRWRNAWFGALGAEYHWTPVWTFRGGIAYDETPTTSFRDPRIPDSDRYWVNIGASYTVNKHISIDAAYAHIFLQDQTVNVIQASGSSATSTAPLEVNQVSANYSGSVDIVALAARYKFN
ncbi:long-chain fatty acid transporter [Legionella sainthelensi]|uniref:Long-chain fatty acid transporter n=1 Tax=Legionella sainthelensi TaxID=28087 RepID=A0A2H5FKB5_9GAMM|nr:outer membrane protein transport protein [Legionella sainthelensi]AUH71987.1 transporter [Legionella sainthelensi]VEB33971.1 long-chain fatty acid transporter [Legionella sainthelensi]